MPHPLSRRDFLRAGASAVAARLAVDGLSAAASPLRLGVIGTGGRGTYLLALALKFEGLEVPALCDINMGNLNNALGLVRGERGVDPVGYSAGPTDYRNLLRRDDVDAVLIATPMQLHGRMAIEALRAGKHVLSEVAAAVTIAECWGLVEAEQESGKVYMLAENCCYYAQNLAVLNMAAAGVFGGCTYAETGYVHDCRSLLYAGDGTLTWRGELVRDYAGNVYPTHALGPVAQWLGINRDDHFETVVSFSTREASKSRFAAQRFGADSPQAKTRFLCGDSNTTLIRTARGVVIDLRCDIVSARPNPSTTYYHLQGEKAVYQDTGRAQEVWIDGRTPGHDWEPFTPYAAEYQHDLWKQYGQVAAQSGHGGADYFVIQQFLEAVRRKRPSPIPAADAAAWSCVIPLSAASSRSGGAPQRVPDFAGRRT